MYKYIFFTVLFIFCIYNDVFSQQSVKVGTTVSSVFLPQGYVLESINGKGFTSSTFNHISNIISSNPASISDYTNISFGSSYQLESAIKPAWMADIDHERKQVDLPQSLGLVIPYKSLRFGIGLSQRYNSFMDLGKIAVTTIENPEGTGEYFTASKTNVVSCYSSLFSYSLPDILYQNDLLNLGLQINYNKLDVKEQIYHSYAKAKTNDISWTLGIGYRPSKNVKFGVFFEKGSIFKDKIKLEGDDMLVQIDVDSSIAGNNENINAYLTTETFKLEGRTPDKLHIGASYIFNPLIEISMDITYIFWSQISDNSKNSIDFSGSAIANITRQLSFSVSFLSTGRYYDKETDKYFNTNENLYGFYILGGLNFKYSFFDLDIAYANNTIISGEWRKQELGKIAIGVYL